MEKLTTIIFRKSVEGHIANILVAMDYDSRKPPKQVLDEYADQHTIVPRGLDLTVVHHTGPCLDSLVNAMPPDWILSRSRDERWNWEVCTPTTIYYGVTPYEALRRAIVKEREVRRVTYL